MCSLSHDGRAVADSTAVRRDRLDPLPAAAVPAVPAPSMAIVGVTTHPHAPASRAPGADVARPAVAGPAVAGATGDGAARRPFGRPMPTLPPALVGFQVMLWWAFRGRSERRAPLFW
jgi:cytochrome d ubiquinol oxidase subunit II